MPNPMDPKNSEISLQFLNRFDSSESAVSDFLETLNHDKKGNIKPLSYEELRTEFTVRDLVC